MNQDNDDENLKQIEQITRIFSEAMVRAQLSVYRKEIVSLTAQVHQTTDAHEIESFQARILRDVAHEANQEFAGLADHFPKSGDVATALARLLEHWKNKHGI